MPSSAWEQPRDGGNDTSITRFRVLGRILALGSLISWMGVIFYLSSLSNESVPTIFPWLGGLRQIVGHFGLYAVLGSLSLVTFLAWTNNPQHRALAVTVAIFFGFAYGALDEFHQSFVPGRSPSFLDLFINSVGVLTGVIGIRELSRWTFLPI